MQNKIIIPGKVEKDKSNPKKFKIKKDKGIRVGYRHRGHWGRQLRCRKIQRGRSARKMPDGTTIRWLNNFFIKRTGRTPRKNISSPSLMLRRHGW